jgi:hypothetical protein
MNLKSIIRKRIWEMDCVSLDACLAASYEWRELANLLRHAGHDVRPSSPDRMTEMYVHNLTHAYCHFENPVSLRIEMLIGLLHNDTVIRVESSEKEEIDGMIRRLDLRDRRRFAGLVWAMGTDPREELAASRRFLHQLFQVSAIRACR